ncbi:variant surface glycoprotein (VSG), putative [Trypanosoma equiperdum]|uniref:Variant surface glycoprotein (VSG), putative n=1 Tax=Trypanosoma equiperdum TaxID=5694 RepID=A0A1G4HZY1_TRYEQ|nr:variant surface glycoprotein (VSG), putative [Trypanosoma equiperdum]
MATIVKTRSACLALVSTALVIVCVRKTSATQNEALNHVTTACLEILFDETLASRYDSEIQRRQQNIESNYKTIRSWHFLAEKTGDVKRQAGFKALVVYGLHTNNAAAQTYEQNKPALETAVAALRQRAANMSTAMQLQKVTEVTAYGTIEAGTTGHAPSSTGSCKYTGITAKTTTQKCTPDQEAKQKININTVAKGKFNQLQLVDDSYLTTLTLDATAGTKGTPNAASNTYDHGDCQSSSPAANFGGKNALGLKITKLGTSKTTTTQTITKTGAGCPNKSQTESTTTAQRLANLVCEAEEAKLPDVPLLSDVKLEDISGIASMVAALSAMLLPDKGGADEFSEQHKNKLKKIINQFMAPTTKRFKQPT